MVNLHISFLISVDVVTGGKLLSSVALGTEVVGLQCDGMQVCKLDGFRTVSIP